MSRLASLWVKLVDWIASLFIGRDSAPRKRKRDTPPEDIYPMW